MRTILIILLALLSLAGPVSAAEPVLSIHLPDGRWIEYRYTATDSGTKTITQLFHPPIEMERKKGI